MAQIYQEFHRLMYFTARKQIPDPQQCEDVVQDSIAKLIENVDTLRKLARPALAYYIVVTIRNTSINTVKKAERSKVVSLETLPEEILPLSAESVDDRVIWREQVSQIKTVWPELDAETKQILEGKYILGYDDKQLGKILGCKPSSVRMKLTRARRAVQKKLKVGEDFDES
jgi:RNA polymerase sigma-70 factor (ECF subfamily)